MGNCGNYRDDIIGKRKTALQKHIFKISEKLYNFFPNQHLRKERLNATTICSQVHNQCPDISRLYTLSEPSVRGVPLYVLEFSDKPGHHEIAEPEMKLVANMHGGWAI